MDSCFCFFYSSHNEWVLLFTAHACLDAHRRCLWLIYGVRLGWKALRVCLRDWSFQTFSAFFSGGRWHQYGVTVRECKPYMHKRKEGNDKPVERKTVIKYNLSRIDLYTVCK